LTRDPEAFAKKAPHLTSRADLEFVQGDVRTFAFPVGRFTYVIHAATETSAKLNANQPSEMLDAIIGGTRRVLEFAQQCGVQKLLLTSSGAVYGKQPSEITHLSEDYVGAPDPLLPGSAYGEGKRVSEHMSAVHARQHGYEAKIARCFAFVGPHLALDGHYAVGNFVRDALTGGPIRVGGDGTPHRSYLYAADLAVWLWTILFKGAPQCAFNVGSAEALSIADLARRVAALAGGNVAVTVAQAPRPDLQVSRYVPAVDRARNELGLKVWITLEEGLRRTLLRSAIPDAAFR
jgi:dTDP-glucose 4,6-dehydratase